jgi:hypothetical protein
VIFAVEFACHSSRNLVLAPPVVRPSTVDLNCKVPFTTLKSVLWIKAHSQHCSLNPRQGTATHSPSVQ